MARICYVQVFVLILSSCSVAQISFDNQCNCEELQNEFDCSYFEICTFVNGACKRLQCQDLNENICGTAGDCSWYNGKCSVFTSCDQYQAQNISQCIALNHKCSYDQSTQKCLAEVTPSGPCSSLAQGLCSQGTDGQCIYLNDKCQVWNNCSDANSTQCAYGAPSCQVNDQSQCVAANTCQTLGDYLCLFAFPNINSNKGYLCSQNSKTGECQDFNPKAENSQTCIIQSYGFYKWTASNGCQECGVNSAEVMAVYIVLIMVSLI